MRYVEAIEEDPGQNVPSLFLAGGITGCPDWQAEMVAHLGDLKYGTTEMTIYNPRRADFPIGDPTAARAQIEWEHRYLNNALAISFWFPKDTLCPIALYELGAWTRSPKTIFVGTDPEYARRDDVVIQTALERLGMVVHDSLEGLIDSVKRWGD